jgi:tRNA threonylcarbamoyladenosine biosynthesis protein TsaB
VKLVAVETTTGTTSVALFEDDALVACISREAKGDACLPMIDELLASQKLSARDITRWAVDIGPGSFTGVRVGVSTVKGIAFATGAEVVGVNAFDALASDDATVIL